MPSVSDPNAQALGDELNKMANRIDTMERGLQTGQLGNSSLGADEYLAMYDPDGNLRGRLGAHPDGSYGFTQPNNRIPPPIPNTPLVAGVLGGLRVTGMGSATVGDHFPVDFSHFNVYVAKEGQNGAILDKIGSDRDATVIAPLDYVNYRVWLTGENLSGTESSPSGEATAMPQKAVGDDITDGIITELKIANDAVTAAKIAAGAVGEVQIGDQVVDVTKLADGSVNGDKIIANAIAAGHIAANAIQTNHIAAGAVQAINIAVGAIQADKIAANAITVDKIAALSITSDKIAANAITATKIDAGAITAEKIQAGIIISDATLQTGIVGRRVVISGPGNDIRFMPAVGETRFARIFSYVPQDLPNDIALEMRAISSDEVNIITRLYLNPNRAFLGVTDADDVGLNGGGCIELMPDATFVGLKDAGDFEGTGMTCLADGQLQFYGGFGIGATVGSTAAIMTDAFEIPAGTLTANVVFPMPVATTYAPVSGVQSVYTGTTLITHSVTSAGFSASSTPTTDVRVAYFWIFRIVAGL